MKNALIGLAAVALAGCTSAAGPVPIPDGIVEMSAFEYNQFSTLEEMADFADFVVVGTVVSIEPAGVTEGEAATGDGRIQRVAVTVGVEETLRGPSAPEVSFERMAWELDRDGNPGRRVVVNGWAVPEVGETYLLFLDPEPDAREVSHYVVSTDGLLRLADGVIEGKSHGAGIGRELNGRTFAEVRTEILGIGP